MIVKKQLWFYELLAITWKIQLALLTVVALSTVLYLEFLQEYMGTAPPALVTVLGTALAFFIAFINNQAYNRWWEARKIWGKIVNDSRSFSRMVLSFLSGDSSREHDVRSLQETLVHRHIEFLYALKDRLRGEDTGDAYSERDPASAGTRYRCSGQGWLHRSVSHDPDQRDAHWIQQPHGSLRTNQGNAVSSGL